MSRRIRLPYWATSILLAVTIGPPMQFLAALADTGSFDKAFATAFLVAFGTVSSPVAITAFQGLTAQALWTVGLFIVFFVPKFMTGRLSAYESDLVPLAPEGKATLRRAFGGVYRVVPVLVVSAIVGLASIPYTLFQAAVLTGGASLAYALVSNTLISVAFASFIWVYFRSLWGLYRLGKEPLRLSPYQRDPMLGVRPVGSISLTLFLSYSAVIGFVTLGLLVVPEDVFSLASIFVLELLAGVMFFLPLNSIHRKMLAQKRAERKTLLEKLSALGGGGAGDGPGEAGLLREIKQVQILQLQKDYVSAIPTWPFDTGILSRFAAIILSVIAILLSRIISGTFHL